MHINEISTEINEEAHKKGFWSDGVNVGEKLMLTVSELSEALEAHRKKKFANIAEYEAFFLNGSGGAPLSHPQGCPDVFKRGFEYFIKDSIEDELADAIIRLLDLAYQLGINIEWHIKHKFEYNKLRPYKHGKAY